MRRAIGLTVAALGLAAVATGLAGGRPVLAAPGTRVLMVDNEPDLTAWHFEPADVTVPAGSTVLWHNKGKEEHSVTADNKSFDSGYKPKGGNYQRTFTRPGTYAYHCAPHPWMKGVVRVVAAAPTPTTAAPTTTVPAGAAPTTAAPITATSSPPTTVRNAAAATTTTTAAAAPAPAPAPAPDASRQDGAEPPTGPTPEPTAKATRVQPGFTTAAPAGPRGGPSGGGLAGTVADRRRPRTGRAGGRSETPAQTRSLTGQTGLLPEGPAGRLFRRTPPLSLDRAAGADDTTPID